MVKQVERALKVLLAWTLALAFWRPGRRARAARRLPAARKVLLVRLDDRVGEALLTTPLVAALAGREVHAVVHPKCARVLDGLPGLTKGWTYPGSLGALRAERFDAVIDCGNWAEPSVTALLVSRAIAGVGAVVGPAVGPGRALMDVPVPARADTQSERLQRLHLLSPLGITAEPPLAFRAPRAAPPAEARVVVNPGGRLDHRRVPRELFSGVCRALLAAGKTPVVTWGPGEEALASAVVAGAPGAVLAAPTDLDGLAALMRAGGLTICNNTGPMHLSVALGVPTVGLFLNMPSERWGHPHPPHQMVDLTGLPADQQLARVLAALSLPSAG